MFLKFDSSLCEKFEGILLDEVMGPIELKVELPSHHWPGFRSNSHAHLDQFVLSHVVKEMFINRDFVVSAIYPCELGVKTDQAAASFKDQAMNLLEGGDEAICPHVHYLGWFLRLHL